MGYREVHRMDVGEVIRRWQAGESGRAVARALGLSRTTVEKYLRLARGAGVRQDGAAPEPEVVLALARECRPGPERQARTQRAALLAPHRDRLVRWLQQERLQLTRVQELPAQEGVGLSYTSLRRYVQESGLAGRPRTTVRVVDSAPGEVGEVDFGRLGPLVDVWASTRQMIWALVVALAYSRHGFVWPLVRQTLEEMIGGLEAAWAFFGGVPQRLVLDNFPAAVAGPDPLHPRLTRGFLEYSQARGFLVDPCRVRHPRDKPRVERGIPYVQERFWKGGTFTDLLDVRAQALRWCREVAGARVHGTTRRVPLVVFADEERAHLRPWDGQPYQVPVWREVTVHLDHHIQFGQALYSAPATTCPPSTQPEVRGDGALVRLYRHGELVKVHPRQPKGRRSTDPDDYPPERTAYALRAPDRLVRQATALGAHVGQFARQLLAGPLPWAKLRQGMKLLRLAERYTPARLDAACARALGFGLLDVRRLERIVILALEHEGQPRPPSAHQVRPLPAGRFARPGHAFDHRQHQLFQEGQP